MSSNLKTYIESLPEGARSLLRDQMQHSVSWFTPEGQHLSNPYERENLLEVLMAMERYVVDTNSHWRAESRKPANRDKAFIIARTVSDEEDNLESVYFGRKVDISNNNLFSFGLSTEWDTVTRPFLSIDRVDEYFLSTFD